jgi:hypothetical protein
VQAESASRKEFLIMADEPTENPAFATDSKDWSATLDSQPPGPARLHVKGSVEFRTTGWNCTLSKAKFPDLNPNYYGVEIRYDPPENGTKDVITNVSLDLYIELTSDDVAQYTNVDIRPVDPHGYKSVPAFLIEIKINT